MYFHMIILAVYTVFLGCLTANTIHLGHRESAQSMSLHSRNMTAEWSDTDTGSNDVRLSEPQKGRAATD